MNRNFIFHMTLGLLFIFIIIEVNFLTENAINFISGFASYYVFNWRNYKELLLLTLFQFVTQSRVHLELRYILNSTRKVVEGKYFYIVSSYKLRKEKNIKETFFISVNYTFIRTRNFMYIRVTSFSKCECVSTLSV